MTANVNSTTAVPDPTLGAAPTPSSAAGATPAAAGAGAPDPADLRLVIEEDQKAGCFVYKTVDWRTGEVVQQLPREQLLKMREAENYAAGAVISTKA